MRSGTSTRLPTVNWCLRIKEWTRKREKEKDKEEILQQQLGVKSQEREALNPNAWHSHLPRHVRPSFAERRLSPLLHSDSTRRWHSADSRLRDPTLSSIRVEKRCSRFASRERPKSLCSRKRKAKNKYWKLCQHHRKRTSAEMAEISCPLRTNVPRRKRTPRLSRTTKLRRLEASLLVRFELWSKNFYRKISKYFYNPFSPKSLVEILSKRKVRMKLALCIINSTDNF